MSDSMDKSISLGTTALTKRSRKFYDGTFRWDSDGFMDDNGVYRDFDCYDPAARAPTPLPPVFPDDMEDENADQITTFEPRERRLRAHLNAIFIEPALPNHDKHIAVPDVAQQKATTNGMRDRQPVTAPRRFTLVSHSSSKKASSNGVKGPDGKKATPAKISDEEQRAAHKISGQKASRATTQASDAKKNSSSGASKATSRQSPREGDDDSIRDSDLSDCPSDLSDWDIGGQVNSKKAAPAPADTKRDELVEFDGDAKSTRKTTRGVAQTVRKGAKNSRAQSTSTAPALRSLESGSFMKGSASSATARRRSARQENAHEGR